MTTRTEALAALAILTKRHGSSDESRLVYRLLESLPPEPFVMPPPGTEFTAYSEAWFRERGAVIVEAGQ